MFTTTSTEKVLFTLIGTLFVLCLFSTVGCGGRYQQELQELREELKEVKSERDTARKSLETAKFNLDAARQSLKTAESAKATAVSNLAAASQSLKTTESARKEAESDLYTASQSLKTTESAKRKAESDLYTASQSLKTTESAKARAESNLNTALRRVKAAESAERRSISERNKARERAKIAEEEKEKLEKLVSLVPQAVIEGVRTDVKRKQMDISVTFSIKNRKDIDGWVYVYFYFQDGEKLEDKKEKPIFIREEFTPESVTDTQTVKLSMPYDKFNTSQPSKLKFNVRIYDEPTESFLDKGPYSVLFSFYPNRDNPVQLTGR